MVKRVSVDADGKAVGEGSSGAAFIFDEGDVRLDKFRAGVEARNALAAGKPAPAAAADDDGSVERVGKK